MREIKFRAWDKDKKQMIHSTEESSYPEKRFLAVNGIGDTFMYSQGKSPFTHWMPNLILMQYTGLKDKNGKEIYEGDILEKSIVKYGFEDENYDDIMKDISGWYLENINTGNKHPLNPSWIYGMEIIGNIYENPELLK